MTSTPRGSLSANPWLFLLMIAAAALVSLVVAALLPGRTAAQPPPPTPHQVQGREDCLLCHGPGRVKPVPPNHEGRPNATCLACHPAAAPTPTMAPPSPTPAPAHTPSPSPIATPTAALTPDPTGSPTPGPSPTPAPTETPQPTATALPPTPTAAAPREPCLSCHGVQGMAKTLPSGEKLNLYIDDAGYHSSTHGDKLACSDCHSGYSAFPHPQRQVQNLRDFSLAQYEVCKRCHFANYTKTLDSIHYQVLAQGNRNAPICTDCHTAHYVTRPDSPRTKIPQTCSKCHGDVYNTYLKSIHGDALVAEENKDVPTCTDCHGVHNIRDPRTTPFRIATPELCAQCHGNAQLMAKYQISSSVLSTYLNDFHGVTVTLQRRKSPGIETYEAVCTDCHGVHNIARTDSPESAVMKANLLKVCQKCHPDATENFPSAWLSHYEPTPQQAPIVFYVKQFYRIFIPFVVVGISLHVLLDLWRALTNR